MRSNIPINGESVGGSSYLHLEIPKGEEAAMKRICMCGKVYGEKGIIANGDVTMGLCLDCFIDWLEVFIKRIEAKGDPRGKLPFLKKLLTKKLIKRQEGLK